MKKSLIKFFAHFDLNVNEATLNRLLGRKHRSQWNDEFFFKYKDRPLFNKKMEVAIAKLEEKIMNKRTNKKIYRRKGRRL